MSSTFAFRVAALLGFAAVALGAFGAHGLKETLAHLHTEEIWKTASLYHLVHAAVLLLIAQRTPLRTSAALLFMAGIFIFSGSLYVLAFTGLGWLGAVTPIGGVCLLAGWLLLAFKRSH